MYDGVGKDEKKNKESYSYHHAIGDQPKEKVTIADLNASSSSRKKWKKELTETRVHKNKTAKKEGKRSPKREK